MPKISIIVPVYNTEIYLHRCVDSIIAQTFTDFELILVDDGSPDNCGVICDEYAEKDSRIRVIHKENGGVSAARNTGIDAATGEFLMFCDSDDFVHPAWVETLYNCISNESDAFVSCLSTVFKSEEEVSGLGMIEPAEIKTLTYFELFKCGQSAYTWTKIYNAEKIRRKPFRFDEQLFFAEDVEFNARYCTDCSRILLIDASLYYYRETETSAARRYRPDTLTLLFQPFTSRIPLIGQENLKTFCSAWFYMMFHELDNVFDKRNTEWSFCKKMRYNHKAIGSKEFQFCLNHADLSCENPILIKLLRKKRYLAFHLAKKAAEFKQRLGHGTEKEREQRQQR